MGCVVTPLECHSGHPQTSYTDSRSEVAILILPAFCPDWLYPKPTGDPGRDRNALTLQFACLTLAFGAAMVAFLNALSLEWEIMPTHGLELALIFAAGVMNRSGKWKWAAWTVSLAVLLYAILLVFQA